MSIKIKRKNIQSIFSDYSIIKLKINCRKKSRKRLRIVKKETKLPLLMNDNRSGKFQSICKLFNLVTKFIKIAGEKHKTKYFNTSQLLIWGQYYSDTKTRQRHHIKRNYRPISLMNIDAKNTSKPSPSMYKKDYTL